MKRRSESSAVESEKNPKTLDQISYDNINQMSYEGKIEKKHRRLDQEHFSPLVVHRTAPRKFDFTYES